MADEEVRPASDEPGSGRPKAGVPVERPWEPDAAETAQVTGEASDPTMASAGADLPPPEPAYVPQQRSLLPALLSVIGLVLIVLLGLNLYMMANPPGRDELPGLQSALGDLKQRVGALEARPSVPDAVGPLDERLRALDTGVAKLTADLADVRAQTASAAAPDPAIAEAAAARIEALGKRDDALDQRADTLDKRVGALETAAADLKQALAGLPKIDLGPLEAKTADLQGGIDGLKAAIAALPKIDLTPLQTGLAALDGRVKPIEAELTTAKLYAAPRAVAAQSVLQALDEGRPFAPELSALQALGTDEAKLAALRPVAAKGAATKPALRSGFADNRAAILEASAPKLTGTVLDRMMASAQGVVKVRQTGASPGSDPDMIVARIGADLDGGAFLAALAEWEHLPEEGRTASAAWAEQLRQRVAAQDAASAIATAAVSAMATSP